ncbi:MAG: DUF2149 domain-containing protein [Oscillospiraceae bacterium]|nr:DUF2149 domain-containing protein [Oscillospiraceae bacterium]
MQRKYGLGRKKQTPAGEEVNPMDGLANLADVMLVFACGLMLALITYWNLDVSQADSVDTSPARQEITQDVSDAAGQDAVSADGLQQYGTVFIDPDTGKLYMVAEGG